MGACITSDDEASAPVIPIDTARNAGQRGLLSAMLGRAFLADPHINWIVRQDKLRDRAIGQLFELILSDLLGRTGTVHATPDLRAAAVWYPPPGQYLDPLTQARLASRFIAITGWRACLIKAYGLNRMSLRHPKLAHYHLQTIGVDPSHQHRGHGSSLLRAFCRECDKASVAGYLETGNEANVHYYERHGFHVAERHKLPNGPWLWLMLRPAGGSQYAPDSRQQG